MRPVSFDRQPLRVRYPMITRQLPSGGAFWTNCPRGRPTTQSSQGQRWRVPALRDLGVSHIARRNLELMGRPRRARAARPAAMPRTGRSGVVGGSSPTATQLTASPAGMGPDKMTDEPTRATVLALPADATTARSFETS